MIILHWDTVGFEPAAKATPDLYGLRPGPIGPSSTYELYRMGFITCDEILKYLILQTVNIITSHAQ